MLSVCYSVSCRYVLTFDGYIYFQIAEEIAEIKLEGEDNEDLKFQDWTRLNEDRMIAIRGRSDRLLMCVCRGSSGNSDGLKTEGVLGLNLGVAISKGLFHL